MYENFLISTFGQPAYPCFMGNPRLAIIVARFSKFLQETPGIALPQSFVMINVNGESLGDGFLNYHDIYRKTFDFEYRSHGRIAEDFKESH